MRRDNDPIVLRREGYWNNEDNDYPHLPMPIENEKPWKGKKEFLKALDNKQAHATNQHMKGSSECRICGEKNGSSDFQFGGWLWPSGLYHYVKRHNIRPSLAFQEFCLGRHLSSADL